MSKTPVLAKSALILVAALSLSGVAQAGLPGNTGTLARLPGNTGTLARLPGNTGTLAGLPGNTGTLGKPRSDGLPGNTGVI